MAKPRESSSKPGAFEALTIGEKAAAMKDYTVRFADMYSSRTLVGVSLWRFTVPLEFCERPLLPPGWCAASPRRGRITMTASM